MGLAGDCARGDADPPGGWELTGERRVGGWVDWSGAVRGVIGGESRDAGMSGAGGPFEVGGYRGSVGRRTGGIWCAGFAAERVGVARGVGRVYGKDCSSKTTCLEMMTRRVERS